MNESSTCCVAASSPGDLLDLIRVFAADLEGLGLPRPASCSPDAYLALVGEIEPSWSLDANLLARKYAKLRFGVTTDDRVPGALTDDEEIRIVCERFSSRVRGALGSEQRADLIAAWSARVSPDCEATGDAGNSASRQRTSCATPERRQAERSLASSIPATREISPDRPAACTESAESTRRSQRFASFLPISSGRVTFRNAAAFALASSLFFGVFGGMAGAPWDVIATKLGIGEASAASMPAEGILVQLSPPIRRSVPTTRPDSGLPGIMPGDYPHARRFNRAIADSWAEVAALYCEVGRCDRADAIYCYVARELPDDATSQLDYASFLLTAPESEFRCAERALKFAERAYELDPDSDRAAEVYAAALFAIGHVARAVSIQQESLQRADDDPGLAVARRTTGNGSS